MISRRLRAIANMTGPCETLYDIGTDHGQLPVFMLKHGIAKNACFSDVSAAALNKARLLVSAEGLLCRSRFALTDGLQGLSPGPGDCVTICNMGHSTIADVLKNAGALPCPAVVQPGAKHEPMRRLLVSLGYAIVDEDMVYENRRFYAIMRIRPGSQALSPAQALLGPVLLAKKPPVLEQYIDWRVKNLERALTRASGNPGATAQITRELSYLAENR